MLATPVPPVGLPRLAERLMCVLRRVDGLPAEFYADAYL
jgi:hypothetical protein